MILRKIFVVVFLLITAFSGVNSVLSQNISPVEVDTISVVNSKTHISWVEKNDGRTVGYEIYRGFDLNPYPAPPLATINGANNTHFIDEGSYPCDTSTTYIYTVLAIDANGITSNLAATDSLRIMLLSEPTLDKCANTINLDWTRYNNMPPEFGKYYILADTTEDGNDDFYKVDSTLSEDETFYAHRNLTPNTKYTYMIRAVNNDGTKTSSSCKKFIVARTLKKPDWAYLRYATVENFEHVKLEWTVGNDASISKFKILRSADGSFYDTIFVNEDFTNYKPSTEFIDQDADFKSQSYTYQIRVCDSCGADMLASENIAKTILLSGKPNMTGNINELSWTPYEGWDFGVQKYRIYRKVNGKPNPAELIDSIFSPTTTFSDNVSSFGFSEGGTFSYYVVAVENDDNNGFESIKDISTSNEIEIIQGTKVVAPNAFTPGQPPDDFFKPFMVFIEIENYSFSIFNKWGQMIFNTTDPADKGWDGKFKGEYVASDSYVYLIRYQTSAKKSIEKRGTVTVVR